MLRVSFRRVKPGKEPRLRDWLLELGRRADEVRKTFAAETVRHEQGFLLETAGGTILVYAVEAEDFAATSRAFHESTHSIDAEHRRVMAECLDDTVELAPIYDVACD
jgi:hypothetical protein